MYGSTLD